MRANEPKKKASLASLDGTMCQPIPFHQHLFKKKEKKNRNIVSYFLVSL